jgi:hypothetical protein
MATRGPTRSLADCGFSLAGRTDSRVIRRLQEMRLGRHAQAPAAGQHPAGCGSDRGPGTVALMGTRSSKCRDRCRDLGSGAAGHPASRSARSPAPGDGLPPKEGPSRDTRRRTSGAWIPDPASCGGAHGGPDRQTCNRVRADFDGDIEEHPARIDIPAEAVKPREGGYPSRLVQEAAGRGQAAEGSPVPPRTCMTHAACPLEKTVGEVTRKDKPASADEYSQG